MNFMIISPSYLARYQLIISTILFIHFNFLSISLDDEINQSLIKILYLAKRWPVDSKNYSRTPQISNV